MSLDRMIEISYIPPIGTEKDNERSHEGRLL